jgi:hypothetical protein
MKPLPDNLRLHDNGELYCADGQEPRHYIKKWMDEQGVKPHSPVNLLKHEDFERLREEYLLNRFGRAS